MKGKCWKESRWGWREYRINERYMLDGKIRWGWREYRINER